MKAAQQQAYWAKLTFIIGCAGTLAVVATFAVNAAAVKAAQRSADAAEKSLLSTERALTELERPHIFVELEHEIFTTLDPGGYEIHSARFNIANYGRVPADIIHAYAGVTQIGFEPQEPLLRQLPTPLALERHR